MASQIGETYILIKNINNIRLGRLGSLGMKTNVCLENSLFYPFFELWAVSQQFYQP